MRAAVKTAKRWVVKVGSSLLAGGDRLDLDFMRALVGDIARLRESGCEVALVSSGAVVAGMRRLGWRARPHLLPDMRVAAALGQAGLVGAYESAFAAHGLRAAQILLTAEDMAFRALYLNARATMRRLLALNVVPVVNENDAIAAEKIRFGDNDRLAALIANLIEADVLAMLTESPGIYRDLAAPARGVIDAAAVTDESLGGVAADPGRLGVGGMKSKIAAARTAARSGAHSVILGGREPGALNRAAAGETIGTLLFADLPRLRARKRWLADNLPVRGALMIDAGAARAVVDGKRSLLPIGVVAVSGDFRRGDAVALIAPGDCAVARGLVNYDAEEAAKIARRASGDIERLLGYMNEEEIVHRDNLAAL